MVTKVISGAQTGADQAGLAAAKELGIETGGWLPKGCITNEGPRPDLLVLYNMKEHPQKGYPPRTERNVMDSDGTVIFGDPTSAGCRLTIKFCGLYNKPCAIFPYTDNLELDVEQLSIWIKTLDIKILNVAGNRESKNPGIFKHTKEVLLLTLKKD